MLVRVYLSIFAGVMALMSMSPANSLVLHSGGSPASTPLDSVVGRWGSNASAVAVSSQHVITTRHQGGGIGTAVTINGVAYVVAEITNASNSVDLRVARLETLGGQSANLTDFVSVYEQTDEAAQTVVLGGFGEGRGADIDGLLPGTTVGYQWDGNQGTQRWGPNIVSGTLNNDTFEIFTNDVLTATFESPTLSVAGEATLAAGDSGGGWFINDGGQWKVAALNQAVQNPNEAIYDPPELMTGVRLSSYSTFISGAVPEPGSLALLGLGGLLIIRRRCG